MTCLEKGSSISGKTSALKRIVIVVVKGMP